MSDETIREALDRALDAYEVLSELGEGIEDEWSYVNDLTDAWRTRFDEVAARHGDDDASDEASAAIDRAIDEIRRIDQFISIHFDGCHFLFAGKNLPVPPPATVPPAMATYQNDLAIPFARHLKAIFHPPAPTFDKSQCDDAAR